MPGGSSGHGDRRGSAGWATIMLLWPFLELANIAVALGLVAGTAGHAPPADPSADAKARDAATGTAKSGPDAAGLKVPRIFAHDPALLAQEKARARSEHETGPALAGLLEEADRALREKPFSVVDKTVIPPSGDKHDYLSLAPYYWPGPKGGLPYVIRDGEINPERDSIPDHRAFARICRLAQTLGLAYFLTDQDKYAAHAALLLRAFFVAPATRMNPSLRFAQAVRGKEEGRAAGIIDTAPVVALVDGLGLLEPSPSLTKADRDGLRTWMRDYLSWLLQSDLGRKEGRARNNHGTWYDVQVVALALATGQIDLATETLSFARKRRIGRQIEPDGRQPEELRRTRAWHYASFNLRALVLLANLGERVGVDLWHYQTPDGRSIRKAIAYLAPFAVADKPWELAEIGGIKTEELAPILRQAAWALKDAELSAAADKLEPNRRDYLWLWLDWATLR